MKNTKHIYSISLYLILTSIVLIAGCDNIPTEVDDYEPEAALYAYLTNGEPLNSIYLERVSSIYGYYTRTGIDDADINIYSLSVSNPDTFRYQQHLHPDSLWIYVPDGDTLFPEGMQRYKLEVNTPQGDHLWSEALVPARFDSVLVVDTLFIHPPTDTDYWMDTLQRTDPAIVIGWSKVDSAGGYFGVVLAQTPKSELVPLDPDWDPNDPDQEIDTMEVNRIGWTFMRDDQRVTTIPWIAFQWEGRHEIQLLATSSDYYDYIFSIFRGGPALGDRPQFNVNGGLGMFAGITRFSCHVWVERSTPLPQ